MYRESFAFGAESTVNYVFTNPPASTYAFVRDMGESLGFIPKIANAQGIGFGGLSPLLPLWKVFRNIAYLLLAVFMIVIGFFIMFRKKIDPKTVVTVQNALPNIIVTLLLITFSYAIVGVLIDLMYLLIMIAVSILKPVSQGVITNDTVGMFIAGNFWETTKLLWTNGLEAAIRGFLGVVGLELPKPDVDIVSIKGSMGLFYFFISGAKIGSLILTPFIVFFFSLAFIFAIIRLLVLLIQAYIQIIMSLILSPFQLLLGAFPGSTAFEGWIKNLIANLAVFPITAIMILLGSIIAKPGSGNAKLWGPPMLNPGGNEGVVGIIGLGILFAIPSVAASLKEALKAKGLAAGGGLGTAVGFATSAGQQLIQHRMQKDYYEKSLRYSKEASDATKNAQALETERIKAAKV